MYCIVPHAKEVSQQIFMQVVSAIRSVMHENRQLFLSPSCPHKLGGLSSEEHEDRMCSKS